MQNLVQEGLQTKVTELHITCLKRYCFTTQFLHVESSWNTFCLIKLSQQFSLSKQNLKFHF